MTSSRVARTGREVQSGEANAYTPNTAAQCMPAGARAPRIHPCQPMWDRIGTRQLGSERRASAPNRGHQTGGQLASGRCCVHRRIWRRRSSFSASVRHRGVCRATPCLQCRCIVLRASAAATAVASACSVMCKAWGYSGPGARDLRITAGGRTQMESLPMAGRASQHECNVGHRHSGRMSSRLDRRVMRPGREPAMLA